jgi:hypothetical protein
MVQERTGDESGAWRVVMYTPNRRAFIFVRGSKTESGVWRMIIDADSSDDFELLCPAAKEMFAVATTGSSRVFSH